MITQKEYAALVKQARAEHKDLNQLAAALKYNKPYEHVTISERAAAKNELFLHTYSQGSASIHPGPTPRSFVGLGTTTGSLRLKKPLPEPEKAESDIPLVDEATPPIDWAKIIKQVGIENFLKAGGRLYVDGDKKWPRDFSLEPLTIQDLEAAAMFTIFRNLKDERSGWWGFRSWWDIFYVDQYFMSEAEIDEHLKVGEIAKSGGLDWLPFEPERSDEDCPEPAEKFSDLYASLCYLSEGGTLIKLPDTPDSKYWRLYIMEPVPARFEDVINDWKERKAP